MSSPFGVGWEVWIGGAIALGIALIGGMWKFANWKGGLDQWKKSVDDWRNNVDNRFDKLAESINTLMSDVAVIKSAQEKDATKNGMIQRRSPLVPSEKALEILEELNIISQVNATISYIQEEIEKRSRTSIYRDIEDPEERFIEIAPSVIHALIKKGKIEEKKIDEAMKKLEKVFPVVTYYGVLLLIAAYILEKGREKGFIAKPSMIYSQIDMAGLKDRDELLASFDGNAEKAIKSLEMSIRTLGEIGKKKELAEKKFMVALVYYYVGRLDEAEREYREATMANPALAEARYNLGFLLRDLERFEEAEKEYREVIRIKPDFAEAHNNLGLLLRDLNRFAEAEKEFREAIKINHNLAKAHNNLGLLLRDLNRFAEAEKEFREAIKINHNLAEAHNNLGLLFDNLKRFEEAEEEYREAIRINPDFAVAHSNLGNLLTNLKQFVEAEKELREAIKISPNYAGAHYNFGNLLTNLKRFEEAEEEYREALRIHPDFAEAHGNLGFLYSQTGKPEEAKKELEIAKRLFKAQRREEDVKKAEELLSSL
jgi:tetratricopeptide (TPR) repeat protein